LRASSQSPVQTAVSPGCSPPKPLTAQKPSSASGPFAPRARSSTSFLSTRPTRSPRRALPHARYVATSPGGAPLPPSSSPSSAPSPIVASNAPTLATCGRGMPWTVPLFPILPTLFPPDPRPPRSARPGPQTPLRALQSPLPAHRRPLPPQTLRPGRDRWLHQAPSARRWAPGSSSVTVS